MVIGRSRFKPYSTYKDSGVEWLGIIPAHWESKPLKYVAPLIMDRIEGIGLEIPYIGLEHIESCTGKIVSDTKHSLSEEQAAEGLDARFRAGDVLFGKLRPYLAKVLLSSFDGRCSSEFLVLRSRGEISPAYLAYQLISQGFIAWINSMTYGTKMPRASPNQVMGAPIAIPDADEQSAISTFLDRETAKIDALIEKKERLIELLQEKRTALITQAVTKGLDPAVPMKDSGVEWIGEIPEHWQARRIAMVAAKITNGYVGPTRDIFVNEGIRYLQSLHIKNGLIDFERHPYFVTADWSHEHEKSILAEGDILVVQTGGIGQVAVVPKEFIGCNCHALIIIRLKRGLGVGAWIARSLESDYGQQALGWSQTGALHPHLECGFVREIRIALPPPDEQTRILKDLENLLAKHDALSAKIQEAIARLKEYRTALISAAVTGKIDVREAQ